MTNTQSPAFLITSCPDHGTKETTDLNSLRVYVEAAAHCTLMARGGYVGVSPATNARAHSAIHADGSDCWQCCERMTLDPNGMVYN